MRLFGHPRKVASPGSMAPSERHENLELVTSRDTSSPWWVGSGGDEEERLRSAVRILGVGVGPLGEEVF